MLNLETANSFISTNIASESILGKVLSNKKHKALHVERGVALPKSEMMRDFLEKLSVSEAKDNTYLKKFVQEHNLSTEEKSNEKEITTESNFTENSGGVSKGRDFDLQELEDLDSKNNFDIEKIINQIFPYHNKMLDLREIQAEGVSLSEINKMADSQETESSLTNLLGNLEKHLSKERKEENQDEIDSILKDNATKIQTFNDSFPKKMNNNFALQDQKYHLNQTSDSKSNEDQNLTVNDIEGSLNISSNIENNNTDYMSGDSEARDQEKSFVSEESRSESSELKDEFIRDLDQNKQQIKFQDIEKQPIMPKERASIFANDFVTKFNEMNSEVKISQVLETGDNYIIVKMFPESLGEVRFSLNIRDDALAKIQVNADTKEVLALMERNINELREALLKIGIETDSSAEFDLGHGGDSRGGGEEAPFYSKKILSDEVNQYENIVNYIHANKNDSGDHNSILDIKV